MSLPLIVYIIGFFITGIVFAVDEVICRKKSSPYISYQLPPLLAAIAWPIVLFVGVIIGIAVYVDKLFQKIGNLLYRVIYEHKEK